MHATTIVARGGIDTSAAAATRMVRACARGDHGDFARCVTGDWASAASRQTGDGRHDKTPPVAVTTTLHD